MSQNQTRFQMQLTTTSEDGVEHYLMLDTLLHELDIEALHSLSRRLAEEAGIMNEMTTNMGVEISFSGWEDDAVPSALKDKTRVRILWEGRGTRQQLVSVEYPDDPKSPAEAAAGDEGAKTPAGS